jgi:hypothetical protein
MIVSQQCSPENDLPAFFELMSPADQTGYYLLRGRVASPDYRYNRHRRVATMERILKEISTFCNRQDMGDALRSLVCGIYWFKDGQIAINTLHLRLLLGKSKSSVNGALAMMQYNPVMIGDEEKHKLFDVFPQLKRNWSDVRQWTIRRAAALSDKDRIAREAPNESSNAFQTFELPQLDMEVVNLFAPDDETVGLLGSRQNMNKAHSTHGLHPADCLFQY